jgi:aspartate-semialdehyde dehydrogenase
MARSRRAPEGGRVNIALFDSSTLVGKGVKNHLMKRRFPAGEVRLFDTGAVEAGGNIAEFRGEPMLAVRPGIEEMEKVDLAFLCGGVGTGKRYLDWPRRSRFVAIDLTQSANDQGTVPVVNARVNPETARDHRGVVASPHPAAQFLSTLLAPLTRQLPLLEVVSLVMEPVSEAGEQGIEELYRQTVGLLNFTPVPQELFGRVRAFNLVPASLGGGGTASEAQVVREVGTILRGRSFLHALKILLVPVFHCHAVLSRVRFEEPISPDVLLQAFESEPSIRIRRGSGGATPAELAGEEKIVLGELQADPSVPGSFWLWGVTDNLATGAALNAVRIAEELVASGSLRKGVEA